MKTVLYEAVALFTVIVIIVTTLVLPLSFPTFLLSYPLYALALMTIKVAAIFRVIRLGVYHPVVPSATNNVFDIVANKRGSGGRRRSRRRRGGGWRGWGGRWWRG